MKKFNFAKAAITSSLVAGALCTALLTGCGTSATAKAAGTAPTAEAPADTGSGGVEETPSGVPQMASSSTYPELGTFTAKTLDGRTFTQDDLAKADVTVINCWGTNCGFCIDEMPDIAAWAKKLPENVQVITFCLDGEYYPEDAERIMKEAGFEGTTLISGDGGIAELSGRVYFLPTTIMVDSSGKPVGQALESAARDLSGTYTQMVNDALAAQGKPAITV